MPKRPHSPQESDIDTKRPRPASPKPFNPIKVATPEAAAAVDANPPAKQLVAAMGDVVKNPDKGDCVVYWMRMHDLRNNRAFSNACEQARRDKIPVIVLFVFSPQDYIAHDRGARKIDFTLRNLAILKKTLADLDIPLHTVTYVPRKKIPEKVLSLLGSLGCKRLYANIEYEVDELRRDIKLCELALSRRVQINLRHNKAIVEPGVIFAPSSGKPYAVYSPYRKQWLKIVNDKLDHYLEEAASPTANDPSVRESETFGPLFETEIPSSISGFELDDADKAKMAEVWPVGESAAREILLRFLNTKARTSQLGPVNPLAEGAEDAGKHNRVVKYGGDRDRADKDTTSRLSPYFSSGVISVREVFRTTMKLFELKEIDVNSNAGVGTWFSEIIWRDFYTDVLASFPRVSMGRPFQEKFSAVVWENHQSPEESRGPASKDSDSEAVSRWKQGRTGVPIVDAAMRCIKEMGWVHNRLRMIVAMYLTKHLMIDWRVGERYFMENLIDGDLASNDGGWQWSASTGVDPCPYFRIFNPHSQSTKADPSGDFIRYWVPELSKVRGPDLHTPSTAIVGKLKYPRPIIEHKEARERALRRYKNPGST
ncbi:hypothetical protein H1R20_g6905, partial [Candolleomyces eurysporus]